MSHDRASTETTLTRSLRLHSSDLLAYFERRLDTRADAADLLSEVMIVAWKRADRIPAVETEARMWLFGIASRVLSSAWRTNRRRTAAVERLRLELTRAVLAHPTESESVDIAEDVRAAINRLPPRLQELVRLVHWEGFSLTQAAVVMNASASTTRSRYARARELLRTDFGAPPHELRIAAAK
ncbi:RNA polymerase sigma factor [Leifsonia sp. A12D58]|uniref:RNA polymerase sigma factor n=1 Tax=Leifsonia sp. A12D58 TaxID=3397674 RepID=UPI0039E0A703